MLMNDGNLKTKSSLLRGMNADDSGLRQEYWRTFHANYGQYLIDFARGRGLTDDEARDAVQETLISLVNALPNYEKSRGRFRAWLLGIAHHKVSDIFRKRLRCIDSEFTETELIAPPATEESLVDLLREILTTAFEHLQESHPQVARERWPVIRELCLSGRKPGDVAAGYELPVKRVYKLKEDWQPALIEIARDLAREQGEFVELR
jgi:RNA polymerase sigma factor (sigma-70 family)